MSKTMEIEIKGSIWFTPMQETIIGIIITFDGFENRAYIGTGKGADREDDALEISKKGAQFPIQLAKQLIKIE